jgi:hypothetical protein
MKAQYRITEDDYANASRFHAWRRFIARPSTAQLAYGGILVALLGICMWALPAIAPVFAVTGATLAIMIAFGLFVRIPSRARRLYRQYKSIQEPITAELTDAGIKFSAPDGESNLPWSKILRWRQNDQFILIYPMPILFYILPKSIAQEGFDVPLLVQRLAEHVGPER